MYGMADALMKIAIPAALKAVSIFGVDGNIAVNEARGRIARWLESGSRREG
jgi:hypothetical protein